MMAVDMTKIEKPHLCNSCAARSKHRARNVLVMLSGGLLFVATLAFVRGNIGPVDRACETCERSCRRVGST